MTRSSGGEPRIALLLLAILALACWWLRFDHQALPEIGRYRDDAYYYFCWVRNLWQGLGPTVSDGTPTSGIHLAWAGLLLPLYGLFGDAGLIEGARWAGLALLAAAAALLGLGLRRDGPSWNGLSRGWAWFGALALLASPALVDEAQNGQETALGCLALALLLLLRDARPWVFVAASILAVAARSDLILFVAALALMRREAWWRRLWLPVPALLAYSLWNWLIAGHPLQDSATPMAWLAHHQLAGQQGGDWATLWWWGRPCLLGAPFARFGAVGCAALVALSLPLSGRWRLLPLTGVSLAWLLGLDDLSVPAMAAVLLALQPAPDPEAIRPARALLLGAVALVALHWLWRWYPRDYYLAPLGVAGAWALARYAAAADRRQRWLLLSALGAELIWSLAAPLPARPWQEAMSLAGRFMDREIGAEAQVGSFNSGILSWQRGGAIVNLDGVVSRPVFAALRRAELGSYLDDRQVDLLCDQEVQFRRWPGELHACGDRFGADFDVERDLVELARFLGTGADAGRPGTDSVRLYARGEPRLPAGPALVDLGPRPGGGRWLSWRGRAGERLLARQGAWERVLAVAVPGVVLVLSGPSAVDGPVSVYTSDGRELPLTYPR